MSKRSTTSCPDISRLLDGDADEGAESAAPGLTGAADAFDGDDDSDDSDIRAADRAGDAMVHGWARGLLSAWKAAS